MLFGNYNLNAIKDNINFRRLGKDDLTIEKMKKDFDAGGIISNSHITHYTLHIIL